MDKSRRVNCVQHGERRATFVCKHLVRGAGLGFIIPTPDRVSSKNESDEQCAWCSDCEKVRQEQGGWNDVSEGFAQITMICDNCFEVTRLRNQ